MRDEVDCFRDIPDELFDDIPEGLIVPLPEFHLSILTSASSTPNKSLEPPIISQERPQDWSRSLHKSQIRIYPNFHSKTRSLKDLCCQRICSLVTAGELDTADVHPLPLLLKQELSNKISRNQGGIPLSMINRLFPLYEPQQRLIIQEGMAVEDFNCKTVAVQELKIHCSQSDVLRKLVVASSLINLVKMCIDCCHISDRLFVSLLSSLPGSVTKLQLFNISGLTFSGSEDILSTALPAIRSLTLSNIVDGSDEEFHRLYVRAFSHIVSLSSLDLSRNQWLRSRSASAISFSIRARVRSLDLSWNRELCDEDFSSVFFRPSKEQQKQQRTRLRCLSISNCPLLSDNAVSSFVSEYGGALRRLNVSGCVLCGTRTVEAIAAHCKELQIVNLRSIDDIMAQSLVRLISSCQKLRELLFPSISETMGEDFLRLISSSLPQLRSLFCPRELLLCPSSFRLLRHGCPRLSSLELLECSSLPVSCLRDLIAMKCVDGRSAQHISYLTTLNLTGCLGLDDKLMCDIFEGTPLLECLTITRCKRVSDKSMRSLASLLRRGLMDGERIVHHQPIRRLILNETGQITDEGLSDLLSCCPELRLLSLSDSLQPSRETIMAVARFCPLLCSFSSAPQQFDDCSLLSLLAGCPLLSELQIDGGEMITRRTFHLLFSCRPLNESGVVRNNQLRVVRLQDCPEMKDECLELISHCRALQRLVIIGCRSLTSRAIPRAFEAPLLRSLFWILADDKGQQGKMEMVLDEARKVKASRVGASVLVR